MKIEKKDEEILIKKMESRGWRCDANDEKRIGFIMPVDEKTEWFRDYYKDTGNFVHGNGKQVVNLKVTK